MNSKIILGNLDIMLKYFVELIDLSKDFFEPSIKKFSRLYIFIIFKLSKILIIFLNTPESELNLVWANFDT